MTGSQKGKTDLCFVIKDKSKSGTSLLKTVYKTVEGNHLLSLSFQQVFKVLKAIVFHRVKMRNTEIVSD